MKKTALPKSLLLVVAIQLGLLVFFIYYTFIGGQTAQGIYDPTWRLATLWVASLMIGGWLGWRAVSAHQIPRTPLDGPLALTLLAWTVSTIFSVNPVYSREALVFLVTYLFFFYLAADVGRCSWFRELVFNGMIATAGLVWTLALLQLSWWYRDWSLLGAAGQVYLSPWSNLPRLSVLGNPNTMASYVALVIPLALYKALTVRTRLARLLLLVWLALLAGVVLLSQSRGGLIAVVVSVGLYTVAAIWQKAAPGRMGQVFRLDQKLGGRKQAWLPVLAGAGLLALLTWFIFAARGLGEGVSIRRQVSAGALTSWGRHPLWGAGPGTLGEELLRYQQPLDVIWADAHNLFLTLAAETGWLGVIGLAWLAAAGFKIMWTVFRQVERSRWDMASLACLAALAGFTGHNLVDSLFKYPLIMLMVAILAGFWLSPYLDTALPGKIWFYRPAGWSYPLLAGAALVLAANTFIGVKSIQPIRLYNQAVEAAGRNDWPAAVTYLRQVEQTAPAAPFYHRQLAFALGYLPQPGPADRREAINQYRLALAGLDRLAIDHANLGCLLWSDGQAAEARQEMALAQALEPGNPLYGLNLGYYLEEIGQDQAAWNQYAHLLASRPDYLQAGFWSQNKRRAEALPGIIQQAAAILSQADPSSWPSLVQLYLNAGRLAEASQVYEVHQAGSLPGSAQTHLARGQILLAMARLEEARAEFEAALRQEPQSGEAFLHLSRIALTQGQAGEAASLAQAALYLVKNPDTLAQSGRVAEAQGDSQTALEQYETAFGLATAPVEPNLTRYATEVARRRPLPATFLPCLVRIYPTPLLIELTQAEGKLLERQGDYREAGQAYRRLLAYEPGQAWVETRLNSLCQLDSEICRN